MKRIVVAIACMALMGPLLVQPGHAEVNVNINVGAPPVPVPVPPPPLPPPLPEPQVELSAPPEFVLPPALGFYVAVGIPYDIVFIDNYYYLFRGNRWFRARYYNGPWHFWERRNLPPGLRKHRFERIRQFREEEYRHFRDQREQYRGRHFKPDKAWKEERKQQRREEKDRGRGRSEGHDRGRHGGRD